MNGFESRIRYSESDRERKLIRISIGAVLCRRTEASSTLRSVLEIYPQHIAGQACDTASISSLEISFFQTSFLLSVHRWF